LSSVGTSSSNIFFLLSGQVTVKLLQLGLFPSVAESQPYSWYNYLSNNTSNPHSPRLDNWQRDRSSNRLSSDSYIDGLSNNSSNPHSPGLDPWQSNGTIGEGKGRNSGFYNLEMDNDQVPQGSGGSSSSSKG
jgi:hypothetical protein